MPSGCDLCVWDNNIFCCSVFCKFRTSDMIYNTIEDTLSLVDSGSNIGMGRSDAKNLGWKPSSLSTFCLCHSLPLHIPLPPSPPSLSLSFSLSQAITYECIRTVTRIYPRPVLIKKAADTISHFLAAGNNNWKYLGKSVLIQVLSHAHFLFLLATPMSWLPGVTSLATLVQVEPKYALDYQMAVIECLDDPDETLKRKVMICFKF